MKKEYRLRNKDDFRRVYRNGKSVANRQLVMYYQRNSQLSHFRLGISVSKKLGNAVVRNRMKRLIKEIVRHRATHVRNGYDMIIIVRKSALGLTYDQLGKSFFHVLKRSGLYTRKASGRTQGLHNTGRSSD